MEKFKNKILIILIILIFCITVISPSAYSNQQYGWPTTYIPIRDKTSSQYTQVVKNSINAWNNAVPGVKFYFDKNAPNTIYSGNYKNNWIGYYSYYTKRGKTYKFNIYLNNRLLSKRSYNYKQSTLVHELGHALSLADNPSAKSIMRHDRNRNVLIAPTEDDKAGVKKHYKLK